MAYLQKFIEEFSGGPHGSHSVYWIPIEKFNQLPIELWKHNRPADELRVAEIRNWIQESKRMDGIIYLACIQNKLVCYESNHRREALKGIDHQDIAPILVDIVWNTDNEKVKQEFLRLNKCVSVPELYIAEEPPALNFDEIRNAVDSFCKNYKKLASPSPHPHRPNFNRDVLTDDFLRIVKEHHISVSELMDWLTSLNHQLSMRDKSKLHPKVIAKCEEAGLWLFAWNKSIQYKK